jgi:site-specific recombinase XerD
MASAPASTLESTAGDLALHATGFELSLRATRKAPNTIKSYLASIVLLDEFLASKGMPRTVDNIRREHIESFQADQLARLRPASAGVRHRSLKVFFRWLVEEGQIKTSPMANIKPPTIPVEPPPILPDEQAEALIKACSGQHFDERRDKAIVLVLMDTGVRLGELAGMKVADITKGRSPSPWVIRVTGKTGAGDVALANKASLALHQYLVARAGQPRANEPWLWLGLKGQLTSNGIAQMLRRRAAMAGIDHLNPHRFRHSFAHAYLAAGGQEGNLMRLMRWTSRTMVGRYGASAAAERAIASHAALSPVDRLGRK